MEKFESSSQKTTSESLSVQQELVEEVLPLYRGVWAEKLDNTQELPIGGSLFGKELTKKLELDFSVFEQQLDGFTEEKIKDIYEQNKNDVKDWLEKVGSNVDPYTYFICYQVQEKMHNLLEVDPSNTDVFEREKMYQKQGVIKLSELKGKTACAERAALGQYLFQKISFKSSYVSGITMNDVEDDDEFPENHSFIVLKHPSRLDSSLIFDIARPHSQSNIPRVLETDVSFNYGLLKDQKDLLVGSTDVFQGIKGVRRWFGVGDPVAGQHKTLE